MPTEQRLGTHWSFGAIHQPRPCVLRSGLTSPFPQSQIHGLGPRWSCFKDL